MRQIIYKSMHRIKSNIYQAKNSCVLVKSLINSLFDNRKELKILNSSYYIFHWPGSKIWFIFRIYNKMGEDLSPFLSGVICSFSNSLKRWNSNLMFFSCDPNWSRWIFILFSISWNEAHRGNEWTETFHNNFFLHGSID